MVKIKYKERIGDLFNISAMVESGKLILVEGQPNAGKSYSIFHESLKFINSNDNIIVGVLSPTINLIEQNKEEYPFITTLFGKKTKFDVNERLLNATYDKSKHIINNIAEGKKLIIIIDEAHFIIDQYNFRSGAIRYMLDLCNKADTVIHVTATPEKLKCLYNYDEVFKFEPETRNTNFKNCYMVKVPNEKTLEEAQMIMSKHLADNNTTVLNFFDNNERTEANKTILEAEGYKVGVVKADNRGDEVYQAIVNDKHLIPKKYDIVYATSVLEAGTNINNTNIAIVCNSLNFDADRIEQRAYRIRNKNDDFIFLYKEPNENMKREVKEKIFKRIRKEAESNLELYNNMFRKTVINFGFNKAVTKMNEVFAIMTIDNFATNQSCFRINHEAKTIEIDEINLVSLQYRTYNQHILKFEDKISNVLQERVYADNYLATEMKLDMFPKERVIATDKEDKEQEKEIFNQLLRDMLEGKEDVLPLTILENYILCDEDDTLFAHYLQEIDYIKEHESFYNKLKKCVKMVGMDIKLVLEAYLKRCVVSDIDKVMEKYTYVKWNNESAPEKVNITYAVCREHVDPLLKKQTRITPDVLTKLIRVLTNNGQKGLKGKAKKLTKEKGLIEAYGKDVLQILNLIYELHYEENRKYPKISSLRKKF